MLFSNVMNPLSKKIVLRVSDSHRAEPIVANRIRAPKFDWAKVDVQEILKDQLVAYSTARILLYAQSFAFLASASQQNQWNLNLSEVAHTLCGGSIIRCTLLEK